MSFRRGLAGKLFVASWRWPAIFGVVHRLVTSLHHSLAANYDHPSLPVNRSFLKASGKVVFVAPHKSADLVRPSPSLCERRTWANREQGFTLLELLVVLAILGLLIGLVAPAVMRQFGAAKEKIAAQSVERLATVLDMYKLDVGSYPTTDQGLQALITQPQGVAHWDGPYLKGDKLPEDPWGHPFVYRSPSERPGHEFDLYSLGPAGQATGPGDASAIASQ